MNQSSDILKTIPADGFVELLKSGNKPPEGLIVEGDVHLGTAKFEHDIHLGNTEFRGRFFFDEATIKDFYCDEAIFHKPINYGNAAIINFSYDSSTFIRNASVETEKRKRQSRRKILAFVILLVMFCFSTHLLLRGGFEPDSGFTTSEFGFGGILLIGLGLLFILASGFVLGFIYGLLLGLVFGLEFGFRPVFIVDLVFSLWFCFIFNFGLIRGLEKYANIHECGLQYGFLFFFGFMVGFLIGLVIKKLFSWIQSRIRSNFI